MAQNNHPGRMVANLKNGQTDRTTGHGCRCTIIIPTFNRTHELSRALSYYAIYGGNDDIVVADSSFDEDKKINRETILSLPGLNILHLAKYPSTINPYHKINDAMEHVTTKYSVLCGDDDFVTSNGINHAMDFLARNPDFTVAYGYYLSFYLENKKDENKKFCWTPGLHKSNTLSAPTTRLTEQLTNGVSIIFYATHRTDFLKMIFGETVKFTDEYVFGETLPTSLTSVHGKMKCLDVLYCIRSNPANSIKTPPAQNSFFNDRSHDAKYNKFRKCLVSHLSEKSELDERELAHLIDDNMAVFIERRYPTESVNILRHKLRTCLKPLDYMSNRCRAALRQIIAPFQSDGMRVPDHTFVSSVDSPSSKYYEDFNNIRIHVLSHSDHRSRRTDQNLYM